MIATFDVLSRTLSLGAPAEGYGEDLIAMLKRHGQVVPLAGVQYGYTLTRDGEQTAGGEWPPPGVSYIETDQDVLEIVRLEWNPDEEVTLLVWLVDSTGERHEASTSFTMPKPESPYPSWVWLDGVWAPPVPHPEDGMLYEWDEALVAWVHGDQDHLP